MKIFLRYPYFISFTLLAYLFCIQAFLSPHYLFFTLLSYLFCNTLPWLSLIFPILYPMPYKHTYFTLDYPFFISFTLLSYLFYNTHPLLSPFCFLYLISIPDKSTPNFKDHKSKTSKKDTDFFYFQ